jgi:hypothetical protein
MARSICLSSSVPSPKDSNQMLCQETESVGTRQSGLKMTWERRGHALKGREQRKRVDRMEIVAGSPSEVPRPPSHLPNYHQHPQRDWPSLHFPSSIKLYNSEVLKDHLIQTYLIEEENWDSERRTRSVIPVGILSESRLGIRLLRAHIFAALFWHGWTICLWTLALI